MPFRKMALGRDSRPEEGIHAGGQAMRGASRAVMAVVPLDLSGIRMTGHFGAVRAGSGMGHVMGHPMRLGRPGQECPGGENQYQDGKDVPHETSGTCVGLCLLGVLAVNRTVEEGAFRPGGSSPQ